jgi:hypothetical protein
LDIRLAPADMADAASRRKELPQLGERTLTPVAHVEALGEVVGAYVGFALGQEVTLELRIDRRAERERIETPRDAPSRVLVPDRPDSLDRTSIGRDPLSLIPVRDGLVDRTARITRPYSRVIGISHVRERLAPKLVMLDEVLDVHVQTTLLGKKIPRFVHPDTLVGDTRLELMGHRQPRPLGRMGHEPLLAAMAQDIVEPVRAHGIIPNRNLTESTLPNRFAALPPIPLLQRHRDVPVDPPA